MELNTPLTTRALELLIYESSLEQLPFYDHQDCYLGPSLRVGDEALDVLAVITESRIRQALSQFLHHAHEPVFGIERVC